MSSTKAAAAADGISIDLRGIATPAIQQQAIPIDDAGVKLARVPPIVGSPRWLPIQHRFNQFLLSPWECACP